MLKKLLVVFCLFLTSCGTFISTSSNQVERKDANRALNADLGVVIDVVPVSIKGETSNIGAVAGGVIGGLVGSKVGDGVGKQVAIVAGSVAGGVIGYFIPVKLGEHNGFQYTIILDETKKPILVIQGKSGEEGKDFKVGDRVTVVYGNQVKVIPTRN
jgi:outer membrane lipoprotein SlyB